VGKPLAGLDDANLAETLAGRAPTAAQQITAINSIYKIDLSDEAAESGAGALLSLASLGGASRFGSRNDDAKSANDSPAGARRTNPTSRSADRASRKYNRARFERGP
jgi:hypothetical protein